MLKLLNIATFVSILFMLFFFFSRGFTLTDEGFILHPAQRLLQGEKIYTDFWVVYTPLSIYATALFFKLLGVSVLSGKILGAVLAIVSLIAIRKLSGLITPNPLIQTLVLLTYFAWAPAHINFPNPTLFALFFGILNCYFILRLNRSHIIAAGFVTALAILSKQNFGLATLVSTTIALFLFKSKKPLITYLIATAIPLFIYATYLQLTGSLADFQGVMSYYTQKIGLEHLADTPWPSLIKLPLYVFPLTISLAVLVLSPRLTILPLFILFTYLFTIRPVTDYVHLAPLLAITGLPLATLFQLSARLSIKISSLALLLILATTGTATAFFKSYYRWEPPLLQHHYYLSLPQIRLFSSLNRFSEIPLLSSQIQSLTTPDDYIYINYYSPLVYLLADRRNATRFEYVTSSMLPPHLQSEVIANLQAKSVRVVLTHRLNLADSPLSQYISSHYFPHSQIGDWTINIASPTFSQN